MLVISLNACNVHMPWEYWNFLQFNLLCVWFIDWCKNEILDGKVYDSLRKLCIFARRHIWWFMHYRRCQINCMMTDSPRKNLNLKAFEVEVSCHRKPPLPPFFVVPKKNWHALLSVWQNTIASEKRRRKKHHQRQWIMKLIEQNKQQFIKISIINHLSTHIFFTFRCGTHTLTHTLW